MSLGLAVLATFAAAQAPSSASQGTTSYPAAFFAASQPTTALNMVNLLPGFTLDTGSSVRGFGGAAGNVLIDGARPPSKGDPLDQVLQRIPASQVLRIDVIRGGAPGIDMQGKTVIANVVRRTDAPGNAVLSAAGTRNGQGLLGYGARLEGATKIGGAAISGSLFVGKGYDDSVGEGERIALDASGAPIAVGPEQARAYGYNYKATLNVDASAGGGKLSLDGSLFANPGDYFQQDSFTPAGEAFEHDRQAQDTGEIGLRYDHGLGERASIETYLLQQVGYADYTADLADSGSAITLIQSGSTAFYALSKTSGESIARTTVKFQARANLSLEAGAEGDFNWLIDRTSYVQDGAPVFIPAADVLVTELRGEAFVTATWRPRPRFTVEAGFRGEASKIAASGDVTEGKTLVYPKPRLVLTWEADGADQLRLRGEREVGQLNFDDFAASNVSLSDGPIHAGNPNLVPQTDWVVEAALDHRFWTGADVTLTGRHYWLQDVIDRIPIYDPAGDYDAPGNIGDGSKDEAAVTLTLPTDKLGIANGVLTGQATRRWSRVIDPTTGLPRPISGLHPLDGELHFTQGLPRWNASWGVDAFNQWKETYYRFDEIDTYKLKTFVALFTEYKPRPDLQLRLELDNVGNRGFEAGRVVYVDTRSDSGVEFTDLRLLHPGRSIRLRARKTFG